jgi:hypothetical protein
VFAQLSKNASLMACYAHEAVMNSYACAWVNGVEHWSVLHNAQVGITHLRTTGDPPAQLQSIEKRLFAAQGVSGGVDYIFDIPIELFTSLGGIRYDRDIEGGGPWHVLRRDQVHTSPSAWTLLWRFLRLFGKGRG